jgi:ubiquinone/menaquinone biosynthesis C-methylase UbiE
VNFDWDAVWDRKGQSDSGDAYEISGFEHFRIDTSLATKKLCQILAIESSDSVLEVGCAAGLLGRHLAQFCHYVGCDRSEPIIKKAIALNHFCAVTCAADNLIFKDKTFDKVFAFSVFQYFPSHDYARQAIAEMMRVAKKAVCISDVPTESHSSNHLLYDTRFFEGWEISGSLYEREHKRFTATRFL